MSLLAFYATASISFSLGTVFGAYWATRKRAAEPARISPELQWLHDSGSDRAEADPWHRDAAAVVMMRSPEPVYRLVQR